MTLPAFVSVMPPVTDPNTAFVKSPAPVWVMLPTATNDAPTAVTEPRTTPDAFCTVAPLMSEVPPTTTSWPPPSMTQPDQSTSAPLIPDGPTAGHGVAVA